MLDEKQFINTYKQKFRGTERRTGVSPKTPESIIDALAKHALAEKLFELGIIKVAPKLKINRKKKDLTTFLGKSKPPKIKAERKSIPVDQWKVEYNVYIKSTAWRELRKAYRADSTRKQECWGCNVPESTKAHDFHHLHYRNFKCEKLDDIIPLCRDCHNAIHDAHKKQKAKRIEQVTADFIALNSKLSSDKQG